MTSRKKKSLAHSFCCSNLIIEVIIRAIRKPTFGSKKVADKIMPQNFQMSFSSSPACTVFHFSFQCLLSHCFYIELLRSSALVKYSQDFTRKCNLLLCFEFVNLKIFAEVTLIRLIMSPFWFSNPDTPQVLNAHVSHLTSYH